MVDDDSKVSLVAPDKETDEAIVSSRQRISWSAMQLLATNETRARAVEAIRQSYIRLGKVRPRESKP